MTDIPDYLYFYLLISKVDAHRISIMSSEEEATAANVLSQMSQIQQISCETIEATVINVGHHCDVETTASQGSCFLFLSLINEGLPGFFEEQRKKLEGNKKA